MLKYCGMTWDFFSNNLTLFDGSKCLFSRVVYGGIHISACKHFISDMKIDLQDVSRV